MEVILRNWYDISYLQYNEGKVHLALVDSLKVVRLIERMEVDSSDKEEEVEVRRRERGELRRWGWRLLVRVVVECKLGWGEVSKLLEEGDRKVKLIRRQELKWREEEEEVDTDYHELISSWRELDRKLVEKESESTPERCWDSLVSNSDVTSDNNLNIQLPPRPILRQDSSFLNQQLETDAKLRLKSPKVKVEYRGDTLGNVVVTTEELKGEEVVFTDPKPIVWVITDHYKRNHCSNCFNKVKRDRHFCPNRCQGIVYCCQLCQLEHFTHSHNIKCQLTTSQSPHSSSPSPPPLSATTQLCGKVIERILSLDPTVSQDPLSYLGLPYLTSSYFVGEDGVGSITLKKSHYLQSIKEYLLLTSQYQLDTRVTSHPFDFSWYLHLTDILHSNCMTLSTPTIVEAGEALFLTGSMVNHSCNSNAHFEISGLTVTIRTRPTSQPLPSDTELTISYHPVTTMPLPLRQRYFLTTYHFHCQCQRCQFEVTLPPPTSYSTPSLPPEDFDLATLFD